MEAGTEFGKRIQGNIERGELVPDESVIGLIEQWLSPELVERGYVLDGLPRTLRQAEALDEFSKQRSAPVDVVFYLVCSEEIILERITGRRVCLNCGKGYHARNLPPRVSGICDVCGAPLVQRPDDTVEVVKTRLLNYARQTEPLVEYYKKRDRLAGLNASLGSDVAFHSAEQVLVS
jgi:adenylate kinase